MDKHRRKMEDLQKQKHTKKEVKKITEILNRKKKEMMLNKQFKNSGKLFSLSCFRNFYQNEQRKLEFA